MENLLLKLDPLPTIRNNKLNTQGEKFETSAKSGVFVSNISLLRHVRWTPCVQRKLKGVINKEPSKYMNLLFSYHKHRCRSFELNLF